MIFMLIKISHTSPRDIPWLSNKYVSGLTYIAMLWPNLLHCVAVIFAVYFLLKQPKQRCWNPSEDIFAGLTHCSVA